MLLHNPLRPTEGGKIRLNEVDAAALNLVAGALVHIEPPPRPDPERAVELFVSPISPELWSDLWQLDLVMRESPGVLSTLTSFLRERRVSPISLETTSFDNGDRHRVSVLCDCRDYVGGSLDVSVKERVIRGRMELLELHAAIAAEFIEQLIFVNGSDPELSLTRNESHFRAHKRLTQRRRQTQSAPIERGGLRLPAPIGKRIEELLDVKLSATQYLVVSDSEDRVLRVHFSSARSTILHVRTYFDGPTDQAAAETLSVLSQRGFDVLGSRLRSGLRLPEAREADPEVADFGCLDVYLRLPAVMVAWPRARLEQLFAAVAGEVQAAVACRARVFIVPPGGQPDDRQHPQGDKGQAEPLDHGGDARRPRRPLAREDGRRDAHPVPHGPPEEA